jgi:cyclase
MRIDYLASDILLFHGDNLSSLATAFIDGQRVLLVDTLAGAGDAQAMRGYLEDELGKRIEMQVATRADGVTGQERTLQWGRHTLEFFRNPGVSADTLGIDVPSADLLFVADTIVGNITNLGAAAPEQVDAALLRLQQRGRSRIVPGHMGLQDACALSNARHYLGRLRERVGELRAALGEQVARKAIGEIHIDELLAPRVHASRFERHWHKQNLARVIERGLFQATPRQAPAARSTSLCRRGCDTVMGMLRHMLGGMARQGL